jgi:hypothetical protein
MYKIEIDIGEWDWSTEKITVETSDFDKVAIIQEFIEFQQLHAWCVDYDVTEDFVYNQCDEDEVEEDEEYIYDEDTDAWYWYDETDDTWYVYDEESDDWIEFVEEESEEESDNVTHFVITRIEE